MSLLPGVTRFILGMRGKTFPFCGRLLKNPGFTLIAICTLALGIGVNTAIFSVVYGVLLRPLPYQNGNRLVVPHQEATRAHVPNVPFSAKEIFDYRDSSHTLDAVVEHHTMSFLLLGNDSAERVQTAVVSANFFDVLGVKPLLGRTFVAADELHGADAVLVLSNQYWKGRHGADPSIVGKVFQMNNRPHTVIGILPPIPQYPVENDVYMPTSQCPFRSAASFIAGSAPKRRARRGCQLHPYVAVFSVVLLVYRHVTQYILAVGFRAQSLGKFGKFVELANPVGPATAFLGHLFQNSGAAKYPQATLRARAAIQFEIQALL